MGKRFLVSLLVIVLVVAIVIVASTFFFSSRFTALTEQTAAAKENQEENIDDLTAAAEQALLDRANRDESDTFGTDLFAPEVPDRVVEETDSSEIRARVLLQEMTLEQKLMQMFFVTPEALTGYSRVTQCGSVTQSAIAKYPVGGIILFSQNLVSMEQTTEMISGLQAASSLGLFIGVDEEGGSVARVASSLGTTAFDDMATIGAAGDTTAAYNIGATQAADLSALGFNVNFSPCADVLTNEANTFLKDRSFGSDPELVSSMVSSVVSGLTDGGMLCSPKHFPGHGSTVGDTHNGTTVTDRSLDELKACDLKPFVAAIEAGAPMIMVGHMTLTELDEENPASLSGSIVTGLLRNEMGYDGIIITDAMNMSAIGNKYTIAQAAVKAVEAGCDMLLCVSNITAAYSALEKAVNDGTISETAINEHVLRILTAKARYGIIS